MIARSALGTLVLTAAAAAQQEQLAVPKLEYTTASPFKGDQTIPAPAENPMSKAAFELGEKLFHEPMLSSTNEMSCATCHPPDRGFTTAEAHPLGKAILRNTPTLYNRAYGRLFSWDGKATTLEQQVLLPIENPNEMALEIADAVAKLAANPQYVSAFEAVFDAAPSRDTLARSLATYVRSITLGDSPADRFIQGERGAMTVEERAGMWIYESKGRCWTCHVRPNFTDEEFHNTGVGTVDGKPTDLGRFTVTGKDVDRGAFKTPTLRGLAFTAPYMHDGSIETLEEVVEFYRRGGNPSEWLDPKMEKLDLTDEEAAHLVAFLRALSRTQ